MSDKSRQRAWLEARKTLITATDLPSILRLPGAYSSPMGVYLDKTAPVTGDDDVPDYVKWGARIQPAIIAGYAEQTGHDVDMADPYFVTTAKPYPLLGASLDARWKNDDQRPVEAKNVGFKNQMEWGEGGSSDVPQRFYVQVMAQMMVTGTRVAELAALFGGRKMDVFRIEYDPEVAAGLYEAARRFWNDHVYNDVPPPVDGSDEWSRYLANRKQATEKILTADAGLSVYAGRLARIRRIQAKLDAQEAEAVNKIKEAIGENSGIAGTDWRGDPWQATYKQAKDTARFDWEGMTRRLWAIYGTPANDQGTMMSSFQLTKPGSRRFLFKMLDKKKTPTT
jgi:putative phage-type endonuclease